MKTKTKIALVILLTGLLFKSRAQIFNSAACGAAPTIITNTFQTVSQGSTDGWVSFTAGNANITFLIKNIFNGSNTGKIMDAKVYSGVCGTQTVIASDTISPGNDTLLTLSLTNLTLGNVYYIYTQSGNFPNQCNNMNVCNTNALFDLRPVGVLDLCGSGIEYYFDNQPNGNFGNPFSSCTSVFPCSGAGPFCQYTICCNNNFAVNIIPSAIQVSIPIYVYCSNGQSYVVNTVPNVAPTTIPFNFGAGFTYSISGNPSDPNAPYPGLTYDAGVVVVTPTCTPAGNFSISPNPVCVGGQACLTYTTNNAQVLVQYTPNSPPSNQQGVTSNTNNFTVTFCKTYPFAGTYNYNLTTQLWPVTMDLNKKCVLTTPVTVTVNTGLLVTAQAIPSSTCYGAPVTIISSAPGATGYTLLPGGITGNTTPFVVTVNPPLGNTQYTVLASNGCTASTVVNVNTYTVEPSFTVTPSDNFFCISKGNIPSITLNVNPGGTYTLQSPAFPSPTQTQFVNSIVVSPTATTTYTIFGYNPNGCLTNTLVTLTQVPCQCLAISAPTVGGVYTGNQAFQFTNFQSKLKVVSDVTLNLPCASNLQLAYTEYIVYPGVKITITSTAEAVVPILGSYFHGCGEMWQGIVSPNKESHIAVDAYVTAINSAVPTLIEDAKVGLTLDNSISNGVCMTPDPSTAYYLRMANAIFNKCIIGLQIINGTSTLYPVPYIIKNTLFTSRNLGVVPGVGNNIATWPAINTVKNSASGLTTMETPYINNTSYPPVQISTLLYGYLGFPQCGILLNNVGYTDLTQNPPLYKDITIGGAGNPQFNCFDHQVTGINLINSNAKVFNSVFQYAVRNGKGNQNGGFGISATSSQPNKNQLIVYNGNGNQPFGCAFYDMTSAIDVNDYHDIEVSQAKFYSVINTYTAFFQGNTFGGRGVNIQTNRYLLINVSQNTFYNIKNPIMSVINNQPGSSGLMREIGQIIVQNNNINRWNNIPIPVNVNPYVNVGIYLADPVSVPGVFPTFNPPVGIDVSANTLNKVHNGIASLNFAYSPEGIHNNTMTLVNEPQLFTLYPVQKGIFAANQVKTTGINLNSITGPVSVWNDSLKGIMTANNFSLAIRCNTTANTARGIEFNGKEAIDFYEDNSMIGSTIPNPGAKAFGHVLDNNATLNATGYLVGTLARPTNNIWQQPWQTAAGGFKTLTTGGSSAEFAKLFIQFAPPFDPDGNGFTTTLVGLPSIANYAHSGFPVGTIYTLLQSAVSPAYGCRIGQGGGGNPIGQVALLEQIASQGFNNQNNPIQSAAIDKHFAYRSVKANPVTMVNSQTLTTFYANAQTSNLQVMVSIEENLANNNLNTAQSQINGLTPANSVEANYKIYYQILKNWKDSTYTQNDSLNLITLANDCPFVDGMVVYQAQTLYNAIYKDYFKFYENCNGNEQQARLMNHETPQTVSENSLLNSVIFPNPNSGNFVLRYSNPIEKQSAEISIFDITGRLVYHENRQIEMEQEMKLGNDLLNGTYLVKVKLEDGTTDVHRLVISK